jgi:hypothetical protein
MRHSENPNLILHYDPIFEGLRVQTERGPLVVPYLKRSKHVLEQSLQQYGRTFAFRLDLRFPAGFSFPLINNNTVMERFFASFKARVRYNRDRALADNRYAHDTLVRYIWCREFGQHGIPHYHLVILLNYNAFCTLGIFELGRDNLFNQAHSAWASSLGLDIFSTTGLVEFPENPFYILRRGDQQAIGDFFYRASYLCKAHTKHYGDGTHGFGSSRV